MNIDTSQAEVTRRTQWAYAGTRILDTPFWGIFNMLPFILYKDLHATPLQLAIMVALKPLVAIFSSYWSSWIHRSSDKIISKILLLRFLALLPFLAPFFDSCWAFIAAFGFYMMVAYGILPTWMEMLKLNVPQLKRERLFSYTQAFGYFGGGLLPFALGGILDSYYEAWRWLFPIAALLSLCASYFQARLIIKQDNEEPCSHNFSHHLLYPWKSAWNLLKENVLFRKYQVGFMLVGSGLMIIQPGLPIYFVDTLHLSYTELGVAITLCKGIGFALGSPLWSKWLNQWGIFRFSSFVSCLAALFPLMLVLTQFQISWLYLSYLIYGFMQSGNELSWNMSGPIFAKDRESTLFTNINTMAVGVRGAFVPALGGMLISWLGASPVITLGGILCLAATLRLFLTSTQSIVERQEV